MRKIICFILSVFLVGTVAFASPEVSVKDISKNIINISGKANSGDDVSILILNPGYTYDGVEADSKQALQNFRSYVTLEDKYSFDIKMNVPSDGGGSFCAVVNVGGNAQRFSFKFYPIEAKRAVIERVNSAATASELTYTSSPQLSVIDKAFDIYGLDSFALTDKVSTSSVAGVLIAQRGTDGYDETDADAMYDALKSSVYLAALNSSCDAVLENNKLRYPELLSVSSSAVWTGYSSYLNNTGINAVNSAMFGKGFDDVGDAAAAFEQAVVLNLFTNYAAYGSGHVAQLLSDYASLLTSAGFNLSRLSSIANKTPLYEALVLSKATSLAGLAQVFNSYTPYSQSVVSGGGGGASSNTGSAPLFVPEPTDTSLGSSFSDIASAEWAREAIETLSSLGIINGRGNGIFDPSGTVTRAEFTKMIVGACGIATSSGECKFTDVTAAWAKPYVTAATEHGIVNGIDDISFAPDAYITREQGATISYRAVSVASQIFGDTPVVFADDDTISHWAKDGIYALVSIGIINGRDNGSFAPRATLTRAEAAKIVYGILSHATNSK